MISSKITAGLVGNVARPATGHSDSSHTTVSALQHLHSKKYS